MSGEDPISSYYYAAVSAHFQYLLNKENIVDPESIDWLSESIEVFDWAESNTPDNFSCHQHRLNSVRAYAAAALYRLTEEMKYKEVFEEIWTELVNFNQLLNEEAYGPFIYLNMQKELLNEEIHDTILNIVIETADFLLIDPINSRACRWGGNMYFPMLVGQPSTPFIFEGLVAFKLISKLYPEKAAQYLESIHTTADYFLGANPLNMTWITGLGEKSPYGVLHLDSWASGDGSVKPGIVPYGPWKQDSYSVMGPWDHHWPEQFVYPSIDQWPGHERWFEQRGAALGPEFTIHQNNIYSAA
ncbi:MAG: glycoside hydrolase family 9 protein, partial [Bacteroidota bacterium]